MRQQRTYGSVRGAISDGRPYRDQRQRKHNRSLMVAARRRSWAAWVS